MNVQNLMERVLTSEENQKLKVLIELLKQKDYATFYEANSEILRNILFVENLDEFLDFINENDLDIECFEIAYMCQRQYGIQIGGYEDDVRPALISFFQHKGLLSQNLQFVLEKDRIYTDCSDTDNFKNSIILLNQILDEFGMRLLVLEDFVYCDCEFSLLLLKKDMCNELRQSWESDNFEIYL